MKNFLIVILLAGGAYKGYMDYTQKNHGAFDKNGNPEAVLFTIDNCAKPCADVKRLLDKRHVEYEEVVVTPGEDGNKRWEEFGSVMSAPYLVVGNERIIGSNMLKITFAIGSVFGDEHLKKIEAEILHINYSADGKPKLVMYTMDGCGYCESAERYFLQEGISYEERNTSVNPVASR